MEKVPFKSLSALYELDSKYIIDNEQYYSSIYSCVYNICFVWDETNSRYNCKIDRSKVKIDNNPIRKMMDKIIYDLGNSIYPLSLNVSAQMKIMDVVNHEEIKKSWVTCAKEKLEKYPSPQMRRYIKMAQPNIVDKKLFVQSLYRDTFFNAFFRNIYEPTPKGEAFSIVWFNFPKKQMNQTYLYEVASEQDNRIETKGNILQIVPEQNGIYSAEYTLGDKDQILSIAGNIESLYQNKLYRKQLSIKSKNLRVDTHFTDSFIL